MESSIYAKLILRQPGGVDTFLITKLVNCDYVNLGTRYKEHELVSLREEYEVNLILETWDEM